MFEIHSRQGSSRQGRKTGHLQEQGCRTSQLLVSCGVTSSGCCCVLIDDASDWERLSTTLGRAAGILLLTVTADPQPPGFCT